MYDVFYKGDKPNLFAHEQKAETYEEAAKLARTKFFWFLHGDNVYADFDFNWVPDRWEDHQLHVFPDQWNRNSETYFINKYCLDEPVLNYRAEQHVERVNNPDNWHIPKGVTAASIDLSWHPDPLDPPFIYHFPTKFYRSSGVSYKVPGATEIKFVDPFVVKFKSSKSGWNIPEDVDMSTVDFTWRPDPLDPPFIYHFPTKFYRSSGVSYKVPGATEIKFVTPFVVNFKPAVNEKWIIPKDVDRSSIDFTWRPDALNKPYIYQFPTKYNQASGVEYHVPGGTEFFFVRPFYIIHKTNKDNWIIPDDVDESGIDFTWRPDPMEPAYIYKFPSKWARDTGLEYHVPGATEIKYVSDKYGKFITNISATFDKDALPRYYIETTVEDLIEKHKGKIFWALNKKMSYDNFDFSWRPDNSQRDYVSVFGSQHQKHAKTFYIDTTAIDFTKDLKYNFVKDQKVKAMEDVNDIYLVDFSQHNKLKTVQHNKLKKTTRFVDNYLAVIKRIVTQATSDHVWIISNICDYSNFDFGWHPEPYQDTMLHVFGPGDNKFGDTFFVHVPTFKEQMHKLKSLEWYDTINYCSEQIVPRLSYDHVPYTGDDLTATIKAHRFNSPYALFYPEGKDVSSITYNPSVWCQEDRAIHTFTGSGSTVLAPRDTLQYLETQCYDYPYILRQKAQFLDEKPLDIVYISNGESTAERLYDHLLDVTKHDSSLRVKRIDGVNGRAEAYKAAAKASTTDWFFTVFAKLEVDPDFNWHWQPDRLQEPKHYIFHALNPVNGLEYGHQGMIAYNKRLVLETVTHDLDFTLSKAHEVVPVRSGIARYNEDPMTAWRTAFREVIKLLATCDDISAERIERWVADSADAENGEMSKKGAQDAFKYYMDVNAEHDKLMLSFEWEWLANHYSYLYPEASDQATS